ncbi:hypothetical protein BGW38_002450 [Lunasporangiospora selenospora]|uniref:Nodulin-like domain-containing protein n=1 Tax=Lunasporangiospora selenospora TaxID=979761 RepID=A0A9P6FS30_9FUNG|nr:hypothetical protein BGW38_002450 [Lunasporangiospora selenospora]
MLVAGSLYVFALYAPSFTGRLGYTQTQTSMIAVIGDIGLYGIGPVSGMMADRLGPRPTSLVAGSLLGIGYGLLSTGYSIGLDQVRANEPPIHFLWMAFFLFLAGMGSSASYMAAFTTLARNFTESRGIALGIPVSFFGLSAAFLTSISQSFFMTQFPDTHGQLELDTVRFLLFLGASGGLANLISVVGLNLLQQPQQSPHEQHDSTKKSLVDPDLEAEENSASGLDRPASRSNANEYTPLLREDTLTGSIAESTTRSEPSIRTATTLEPSSPSSASFPAETATTTTALPSRQERVSVSGKAFFKDRDAQYFFVVMFCLTGSGLMIINSISAIVDSIAAGEQLPEWMAPRVKDDRDSLAAIRAHQVLLISISSYMGRLVSGFGSDYMIRRHDGRFHRIDVVPMAAMVMACAQLAALVVPLRWIEVCSVLTGFAYGGFFGIAGTIVAEFWGEETCGQNWGWLSWSSAFGGMLFNLLFGIVMDSSRQDGDSKTCRGHGCYGWALGVSLVACLLSWVLSIHLGRRQRRREASMF